MFTYVNNQHMLKMNDNYRENPISRVKIIYMYQFNLLKDS